MKTTKHLIIISLLLISPIQAIANSTAASITPVITFLLAPSITYNAVTSPYTGKKWLDRNLGASQVCTALDDTACYGDYYQWGRNTDGHEKSTSATTSTQATDIYNTGTDFIATEYNYDDDWAQTIDSNGSLRVTQWLKTDGSSVCPTGYRVPTMTEILAETTGASTPVTNNTEAYANFLKLPSSGYRDYSDSSALVLNKVTNGYLWSSDVNDSTTSNNFFYQGAGAGSESNYRARGLPVRCIETSAPVANAGVDQNVTVTHSVTLDASASSDVESDTLTYAWSITSKPIGSSATLSSTTALSPIFTADIDGAFVFALVVNDGALDSTTDTVTIYATSTLTWKSLTYKSVISPYTGKAWLDRNLGATQVCTALNDTACYGGYFQWGRAYDGHEASNSATTTRDDLANDVNTIGHANFITIGSFPWDWASIDSNGSQRSANWSATDGSSVCPVGYRVPTNTELATETTAASTPVTSNTDAYDNFLKIPAAGYRSSYNGSMFYLGRDSRDANGLNSHTWSSSVNVSFPERSYILWITTTFGVGAASMNISYHGQGHSVRCLKD